MANTLYNHTSGQPANQTRGTSATIRAEFDLIQAGFDGAAPLISPAFTGTPTAPTAPQGTNNTQVATTAFVVAQAFAGVLPAQTGNAGKALTTNGTTASWSSLAWSFISGTPTTIAGYGLTDAASITSPTISNPTFTGTPVAPTAAQSTNTTQIATTAYVIGQGSNLTPIVNGTATVGVGTLWARSDHVHPTDTSRLAQILAQIGNVRVSVSGANLLLLPYKGNTLFINGVACTVPAAGITLGVGGLSASTNYNIYATQSGGIVNAMEASTTAHAVDATYGNEIKSGDANRALVAKGRTSAGTAWVNTDTARFLINWFHQRPIRIYTTNGSAPTSTTSAITNVSAIMEFLCWGDTDVPASFIAETTNNTANAINNTALGLDTTTAFSHIAAQYQAYIANGNGSLSGGTTFVPTEGYHYISMNYSVGAGTGTWQAGLEASGTIQG